MKAIRVHQFGEPDVMQLQEVPDLRPGPGQLVVRIKAAGVNPVDTYVRAGNYTKPPLPYTPGHDGAGVVESLGEAVKVVKPGDRVYITGGLSGTYAEQILCEAGHIHPLPEAVSFSQGAGVGVPYATAYRALFHRAKAMPGEVVLIHGASGGVGIAAIQLARAAGMTIIGTAGSESGRTLVKTQGACHVLNHRAPDYLQTVMTLTEGRGVNVILEVAAHVNLGKDLGVLARGGRVVVIGSRGSVEINPRDTMARDAAILGMSLFNASDSDLVSIHAALVAGLGNNTLRPVIAKEFPLTDAASAHRAVLEPGALGKIVLVP
jgi:NADPH2:quinone reductase